MDPRRKMREILRLGLQMQPRPATSPSTEPILGTDESSSSRDMSPREESVEESGARASTDAAVHLLLNPGTLHRIVSFCSYRLIWQRVDIDMSSAIALAKELHQKKGK